MHIALDASAPAHPARLVEADEFGAFSVWLEAGDDPDARIDALSRLGRPDGTDHVWVAADRLLELAGRRAEDPVWRASLDAMLAYAARHGWVDDQGAIRAHVETPGERPG